MTVELLLFQIPIAHPTGNWNSVVKPMLNDGDAHYIGQFAGHHLIGIETDNAAAIQRFQDQIFGDPAQMITTGKSLVAIRDRINDFYYSRNSNPNFLPATIDRYVIFAGLDFAHGNVTQDLKAAGLPEDNAPTFGHYNNCNFYYVKASDTQTLAALQPLVNDNCLSRRGTVDGYSPRHCWSKISLYYRTWDKQNYPYANVDAPPEKKLPDKKIIPDDGSKDNPPEDNGPEDAPVFAEEPSRPVQVTRFIFNRLPMADKYRLVFAEKRRRKLAARLGVPDYTSPK